MKDVNEEMSFIGREKAYCKGWYKIYELSDEYFLRLSSEYSELLKQATKDLKKDVMNLQCDEWQNNFDKSCELMEKMNGVSELKKFLCTPIYKEEMITAYETEERAYDLGKYQAFYKLHTVLFNSIEALSIEASKIETEKYEEMKLKLSGGMELLLELSSITGFEIFRRNRSMNYTQAKANQIKFYFQVRVSKIKDSDFTTYQKDKAYASLMTELESIYDVPCAFSDDWEKASEGNKILLELYRSIGNMRAFEEPDNNKEENTDHNIMIVCTVDTNDVYPVTIAINDICQTAKDIIGQSFEIVRARKLHKILPNAVFLCADDFAHMKNPSTNRVGTYLYDGDGYDICGTICILKEVFTDTGYDLRGLYEKEASLIQDALLKEFYPYRGN